MTLENTDMQTDWMVADGVNKNWNYTFKVYELADIKLQYKLYEDDPEEDWAILTENVGFHPNANFLGGYIKFPETGGAALPLGFVRVVRDVPYTQKTAIGNEGSFRPEIHERAFDRLTMQTQQLSGRVGVIESVKNWVAEAKAWAQSDTNPDPDDVNSKSSKTWAQLAAGYLTSISLLAAAAATSAANAAISATQAATWAAGVNLPAISAGAKHKTLKVKADETGYRFSRNPFYDPYDYGALGNGVTDDTAALLACQTAANANEGAGHGGGPKGRGVSLVPCGNFPTDGIVAQNPGEKWLGCGGTVAARAANQYVFSVGYAQCVVENFTITQFYLPTAARGAFLHNVVNPAQGAPDCLFRRLVIYGGYWGIEARGGGDSIWFDCTVSSSYSDFLYLTDYNGYWGIRCKFDGAWPAGEPVNANIKGAWANSTVYALKDIVTVNGYYFQCTVPGTSAATGTGPAISLQATTIVDGTASWGIHRTTAASAIHLESDTFINFFWLTDMTGSHINSCFMSNTVGTYAPQTVKFLDACEFGSPLLFGCRIDAADDVEIKSMVIDSLISSTGVGIACNVVRGIDIHHNMFRGMYRGLTVSPNTTGLSAEHNQFAGCTEWAVLVFANASRFSLIGNVIGDAVWGNCGNGIAIQAGTSDEYVVALNRASGVTGVRWSHGTTTGLNKYWDGNV